MGRRFSLALALLAAILPATAGAESAVLYQLERVGAERVLFPRLIRVPAARTLLERLDALLRRLKGDKPSVYGRAAFDLSPERVAELENARTPTILLDPDRARTRDEALSEIVYTFTAAGAAAVRAGAGGEMRSYGREDIGFSAYVLAMPLWLALPPSPHAGALARLPGGEVVSVQVVEKRLRDGDPVIVSALSALVKDPVAERRLRAVRALGYLPPAAARQKLMGLIADADPRLRAAAVDGLAAQPSPEVLAALEKVVGDDRDEDVRAAAARALAKSGDRRAALAGLSYLLRSPEPTRKVALLRELRGAPIEGLLDALLPLLGDGDAGVRAAALEVLAGRTESRILEAVAPLVDRDSDAGVRAVAARMLRESREPRFMSRGLAHDLRGGDEATAAAAAARLGELGEIGREPLEAALAAGATLVRKAAANALLRIGDPRSLPALTAAARAGLPEAELAAAGILAKLPAEEIAKRIAEGDVLLRRLAVSAAATAGGPAVQKALLAGARDPEREVRLAAALALGKLGGEGAVAALAALLEDEADAVREAAADSLGKLAEPAARPALLKLTRYGNRRVRRAVMRALARLPGPPPREAVVTLLESLGDDDPSVREHALLALAKADRRDRRVVPVVRLQLKDSAAAVRRASVIAVGALGGSAVISSLKEALTDEAPEVRLAAVEALEQIGGDDAATTLARHAGAEKDPKVAARAREASERLKQK